MSTLWICAAIVGGVGGIGLLLLGFVHFIFWATEVEHVLEDGFGLAPGSNRCDFGDDCVYCCADPATQDDGHDGSTCD